MKPAILIFSLVLALCGCTSLVKPVAGNFHDDPLLIDDELSPQARRLLDDAFAGFDVNELVDSHLHIIGLGANGTGAWVNPDMQEGYHWLKRFKFVIYKNASGIEDEENADQQYIERLIKLIDGMRPYSMRFMILAFDKHYDKNGEENLDLSPFYIPNEYVVSLAQQYPQFFIPVISVHPYRKDALQELDRWHSKGVRYIKWLPNAQGIDPSDEAIIPYYQKMVENDMVLITHTGEENAVDGDDFQRLGNPQLLHLPLQQGVKIIMAHVATLGMCNDIDVPDREVSCYQLAVEMLKDDRYVHSLYADISTITQYNHVDKLSAILNEQALHHRFVNGSDYPLPAINFLYKTSQLSGMGFISEDEAELLNEIYSYNPLLFDFVLKRTIRSPETGLKLSDDVFVLPASIK